MNYIFCWGGGAGDQKNKYVWRYDEIMIYLFFTFWGVISINLGLFKVNVQIWKMFLGSLKFEDAGSNAKPRYLENLKVSKIWSGTLTT